MNARLVSELKLCAGLCYYRFRWLSPVAVRQTPDNLKHDALNVSDLARGKDTFQISKTTRKKHLFYCWIVSDCVFHIFREALGLIWKGVHLMYSETFWSLCAPCTCRQPEWVSAVLLTPPRSEKGPVRQVAAVTTAGTVISGMWVIEFISIS